MGTMREKEAARTCRICGCTDERACAFGCWWVRDPQGLGNVCSACESAAHRGAADAECIHGLTPASCTICLHGVQDKPAVTIDGQFTARYDGDCRGCDLAIVPGQPIYLLSNGAYVHRGCEPDGASR